MDMAKVLVNGKLGHGPFVLVLASWPKLSLARGHGRNNPRAAVSGRLVDVRLEQQPALLDRALDPLASRQRVGYAPPLGPLSAAAWLREEDPRREGRE
jgi:hypothetical protein